MPAAPLVSKSCGMSASSSFEAGAGLSSISSCRTILPSPLTIFLGGASGIKGIVVIACVDVLCVKMRWNRLDSRLWRRSGPSPSLCHLLANSVVRRPFWKMVLANGRVISRGLLWPSVGLPRNDSHAGWSGHRRSVKLSGSQSEGRTSFGPLIKAKPFWLSPRPCAEPIPSETAMRTSSLREVVRLLSETARRLSRHDMKPSSCNHAA